MSSRRIPERTVQAQVVAALRSVGAHVMTLGTVRPKGDRPGTMQSRGWPDVGAFLPAAPRDPRRCDDEQVGPHWLWVECKAKGGRLRPEQADFARRCHEVGIAHLVGGLDVVLAYLQQYGYIREYPGQYRRTA